MCNWKAAEKGFGKCQYFFFFFFADAISFPQKGSFREWYLNVAAAITFAVEFAFLSALTFCSCLCLHLLRWSATKPALPQAPGLGLTPHSTLPFPHAGKAEPYPAD